MSHPTINTKYQTRDKWSVAGIVWDLNRAKNKANQSQSERDYILWFVSLPNDEQLQVCNIMLHIMQRYEKRSLQLGMARNRLGPLGALSIFCSLLQLMLEVYDNQTCETTA